MNVGGLILAVDLKAEVVDNVAVTVQDVSSLSQLTLSSQAAQVLQLDIGVGVGGGLEAGQDALLGKEEGSGRDGEEGAPVGGQVSPCRMTCA